MFQRVNNCHRLSCSFLHFCIILKPAGPLVPRSPLVVVRQKCVTVSVDRTRAVAEIFLVKPRSNGYILQGLVVCCLAVLIPRRFSHCCRELIIN